ncbi:UBX domain-containing protein 7 [Cyclospora cayetanensis]|uniref:UBX domain-containing protein 7 n=1 Tax=Cyclospora cayetanensis TaxID=88456 RepID=A0A6P6S3B3_9EIME|nr:UBX domain-containing protein 7 [Cyclospora cayetanensis]
MDFSEAIPTLMEFAGIADAETARQFLDQAGGDVNAAAALYFDTFGRTDGGLPAACSEEDLRAPDPEYTQTLLDQQQQNVTALAVESSAGTVAFRGLFELPGGFSCQEPFSRARELAHLQKKWLLVNIQQVDAFESLRLNRDVWKAEVVQDLINDFFIFWQRTNRCEEGQVFCDLYRVTALPHVCVVDPLTGRRLKSWNIRLLSDPIAVQSEFFEFIEQQQMADRSRNGEPEPKAPPAVPSNPTDKAPVADASPAAASFESTGAAAAAAKGAERCASARAGEQAKKTSLVEVQPSDYTAVNSQLQDLMKLREQRRQQQMQAAQSG